MCSFLNIKVQITLVLTSPTLGNKLFSDSTLYLYLLDSICVLAGTVVFFLDIVGYDQIFQDCIL